eukprot:TRINITY_DN67189_c0_g1_i1.p1 TRINITY_DN67189_c0_g1~~TRINITY_DN67189_c0_g1_i1.p1  ORF type:complete len:524 (+),score=57.64 TRINITY_DN67189_c0_g1_i1:89-1660(+)
MCACPVPYILAGAWLVRKVPVVAKHPSGRVLLATVACGAAGGLHWLLKRRKQRRTVGRPLEVGLDLAEFGLSDHGFIPYTGDVLQRLPDEFAAWEHTADTLVQLARSKELRRVVDSWPYIDVHSFLDTNDNFSPAVRRAYVVLALVAHAYSRCDETRPRADLFPVLAEQLSGDLPRALAEPLRVIASRLDLPPGLTHVAMDAWNCLDHIEGKRSRVISCSAVKPDDLRCITSLTGSSDEAWYHCTMTAVQRIAGPSILACYDLLAEAVPRVDHEAVRDFLCSFAGTIDAMSATLRRLPEKCRSDHFWRSVTPSLSSGGEDAGLFSDATYEALCRRDRLPEHFACASAGISSISVFDAVLGVTHTGRDAQVMEEIKRCMPGRHRKFLERLEMQMSLRTVLLRWRKGQDHGPSEQIVSDLIERFNDCLDRLTEFRRTHLNFVGFEALLVRTQGEESMDGQASGSTGTGSIGSVSSDSGSEERSESTRRGARVVDSNFRSSSFGANAQATQGFLHGTILTTLAAKI